MGLCKSSKFAFAAVSFVLFCTTAVSAIAESSDSGSTQSGSSKSGPSQSGPSQSGPSQSGPSPCLRSKQLVGWIERVKLMPEDLELEAKLAPAIGTSSLHAENIKAIKKSGKSFVRFSIEDRQGKKMTLEKPVLAERKTVSSGGAKHKRYVVKIGMCIKDVYLEPEVLLADRTELDQELRVGRDILAGLFVIDPSVTHTSKPDCSKQK